MGRDLLRSLSESRAYAAIRTLYQWAANGRLLSVLGTERGLLGVLTVSILASAVSVFRSNPAASIEFLSFALVFVPLAVLIERFVEVPAE